MTPASKSSTIIGIIAIILGVLILVGGIGFGDIVNFLGIALIIAGILILVNVLTGSTLAGVLFLILGVLLVLGFLPGLGAFSMVLEIIIGVVLIIYGIMQLR